jgi:hypothetical protein
VKKSNIPKVISVNPFQLDCHATFALRAKRDIIWFIQEFTGYADLYILAEQPAESIKDEFILFHNPVGSDRAIIIDRNIRKWFGQ